MVKSPIELQPLAILAVDAHLCLLGRIHAELLKEGEQVA